MAPTAAGRLLLLATSPRVAPGLLSWSAWTALHAAAEVYAATADHPLGPALAGADVRVLVPPVEGIAELAEFLLERAEHVQVVWLVSPEGDAELADRLGSVPGVLTGSWDLRGARLLDLVAVMDRLRSPGGCPWDAEQTHTSLLPYLLEETYETVEVIESGDLVGLREELGDLLLQVVFHARVAEEHEEEPWSLDDVADGIVSKLVSRHPHVFGDPSGRSGAGQLSPADVEQNWEALKRAEKGRTSSVDGVPLAQPALALAAKLISRATKSGVEIAVAAELPTEPAAGGSSEEEVGALLLAVVARAHADGIDPEAALRGAARRYAAAVRLAEIASAP